MRRVFLVLVLICLIGPAGCGGKPRVHEVHRDWAVVGGHGATVELAYEHAPDESVQASEQLAYYVAKDQCNIRGYKDAEAVGREATDCIAYKSALRQGPCSRYRVTRNYLCVGR